MSVESFMDPLLSPLLKLGYFWALFVLSFVITIIITLIYKYTTNQSLMKDLKDELKALQKEAKELRNQPEKAMEVQKKVMDTNSKYMMHSFKPMIFTFIPVILFFGWMNLHLAYYPIAPGEEFSVTMDFNDGVMGFVDIVPVEGITSINGLNQTIMAGKASWILKGEAGEYSLVYNFNGATYYNDVLITNEKNYAVPLKQINKDGIKSITINNKPVLFNFLVHNFGWLGTYIIFSLILSSLLRKWLKVY